MQTEVINGITVSEIKPSTISGQCAKCGKQTCRLFSVKLHVGAEVRACDHGHAYDAAMPPRKDHSDSRKLAYLIMRHLTIYPGYLSELTDDSNAPDGTIFPALVDLIHGFDPNVNDEPSLIALNGGITVDLQRRVTGLLNSNNELLEQRRKAEQVAINLRLALDAQITAMRMLNEEITKLRAGVTPPAVDDLIASLQVQEGEYDDNEYSYPVMGNVGAGTLVALGMVKERKNAVSGPRAVIVGLLEGIKVEVFKEYVRRFTYNFSRSEWEVGVTWHLPLTRVFLPDICARLNEFDARLVAAALEADTI